MIVAFLALLLLSCRAQPEPQVVDGTLAGFHRNAGVTDWQRPGRCTQCHQDVEPPEGHGAGWIDGHGAYAKLSVLECRACHRASTCVGCHEQKDRVDRRVHDPTWLSVHSVDARIDPSSCGVCHLQTDCVACHVSGDRMGP